MRGRILCGIFAPANPLNSYPMISTNHLYNGSYGPIQVISFSADEDEILALIGILLSYPIELNDLGKTEDHITDKLLTTLHVALKQIKEAK